MPMPFSSILEPDPALAPAAPPEAPPPEPVVLETPAAPEPLVVETVPTEAAAELPPVFVGVDGGGSRTRVVIADEQGRILGRGEAGGSNINFVGEAALRTALADAWKAAWRAAGQPARPAKAAFLGLAGVASAGAHETVRLIASQIGMASVDDIGVDHDIAVALAGAFEAGPGLALVVGTGSSCFGRNAYGHEARAGGYGPVIDDGGSGYWLGRMALRAAVFAADGRGPATTLTEAVFAKLIISEIRGVAQRLYREQISRETVATLAPDVIAAAQAGDPVAITICARGADDVAAMAEAVSRSLDLHEVPVAFIGSAGNHPYYRGLIETAVRTRLQKATFPGAKHSPEVGALLLAYRLARLSVHIPS